MYMMTSQILKLVYSPKTQKISKCSLSKAVENEAKSVTLECNIYNLEEFHYKGNITAQNNSGWLLVVFHFLFGFIHLVLTQNFPKNWHFLPPIRTRTCAYQGIRNVSFSENFAYVLNGCIYGAKNPERCSAERNSVAIVLMQTGWIINSNSNNGAKWVNQD